MDRFHHPVALVCIFSFLAGCGGEPQVVSPSPQVPAVPGVNLQPVAFTGIAEPVSGRLQVVTGPQAAIGLITEDADGNPATAAPDTAQVYGASAGFTSTPSQYPPDCNPGSPMVMFADVEVRSGFTEQLRNVYARMTAMSSGPTFCTTTTSPAPFPGQLDPTHGLYLYPPLDGGADPASALARTVRWGLNLPDNSAFWFKGELWAEVIPQPPTIVAPADGAAFPRNATTRFKFRWSDDPLADGTDPEGFGVARPTGGAMITLDRCGRVSAGPYDPLTCTSTVVPGSVRTRGSYTTSNLSRDRWYRWTLRSAFRLPGNTTRTLGSTIATRHFSIGP